MQSLGVAHLGIGSIRLLRQPDAREGPVGEDDRSLLGSEGSEQRGGVPLLRLVQAAGAKGGVAGLALLHRNVACASAGQRGMARQRQAMLLCSRRQTRTVDAVEINADDEGGCCGRNRL